MKRLQKIWVFPKIGVPPNHPILVGFAIINHPFWGIPIFGNTHICYFVNLAIFQLQASFSSRELCAVDLNIKSPHEEPGTSEPCDAGGKSYRNRCKAYGLVGTCATLPPASTSTSGNMT